MHHRAIRKLGVVEMQDVAGRPASVKLAVRALQLMHQRKCMLCRHCLSSASNPCMTARRHLLFAVIIISSAQLCCSTIMTTTQSFFSTQLHSSPHHYSAQLNFGSIFRTVQAFSRGGVPQNCTPCHAACDQFLFFSVWTER